MDHRDVTRVARPASTICPLRDTARGPEVLMVRRSSDARVMGGAWVFPGGVVDGCDDGALAHEAVASVDAALLPWRAAAVRELVEETGVWLLERGVVATPDRPTGAQIFARAIEQGDRFAGDSLRYFANWITPALLPVRFDTRFFAAVVPSGVTPAVDGDELVDAEWIGPGDALERGRDGTWLVAFPTRRTLADLSQFASTRTLENHVEALDAIRPVEPRIVASDAAIEILMPGDPGFAAAAPDRCSPSDRAAIESLIEAAGSTVHQVGSA
jgi:8-oxo-dGTP pyrophosphatase MutT (NUDIX family)